jgi:tRNA (guanine-N7-)-methyltransferase
MKSEFHSVRIIPDDWVSPLKLEQYFDSRPLHVDVGCGKGRFLLARAAAHPEWNFLGIDRMLRRIRKVDNKAQRRHLDNVRLFRMDAFYATAFLLPTESVSTFYIFFPDPWPKKRHHDHRIFNNEFIDAVFRTLKSGGEMHFATDHLPYFEEVLAALRADGRFEEIPAFEPIEAEKTDFEIYYIQHVSIGRCSFRKPAPPRS